MDRADFIHLVRLSEQASADDSTGYRRGVAVFALLGYAWVLACMLAAVGMLWWSAHAMFYGRVHGYHAMTALAGAGLLWTGLRALWVRLDAPEGLRIAAHEAPALFEALERIRRKIKGPPIHEVVLTGDLNASIGQHPRWGLFGGARNFLTIGLPLLMALDRQRLLAVLAHEYGHLRGDHGRFAAWVYRTRLSWAQFHEGLQESNGVAAMLTQGFLDWYFPRFVARTFAMARQDEYEADRISARLLGAEAAGAALIEIGLKGDWLQQHFWREHWALAAAKALPIGPYGHMQKALARPLPDAFAQGALRQHLRQVSSVDDTHPVLRDRLEALDVPASLPAGSRGSAMALLGAKAAPALAHFDKEWCRENATSWKQYHAVLGRLRSRVEALLAAPSRTAAEWTELGDLQRRLDPHAVVQTCYEQALAQSPSDADALRGLFRSLPADAGPRRLELLQRLHGAGPENAWWAAQEAVSQLEADPQHDAQPLKEWRARLKDAEAAEQRAWSQLSEPPYLDGVSQPGLTEFERAEFEADLARHPQVARAWLLRKSLPEFPRRRAYLLCVDLPGLDDAECWAVCRELEQSTSLRGAVLALWPDADSSLANLGRHGPPLYERHAT
jgi:Zn-dependent protease with chaperone function